MHLAAVVQSQQERPCFHFMAWLHLKFEQEFSGLTLPLEVFPNIRILKIIHQEAKGKKRLFKLNTMRSEDILTCRLLFNFRKQI